MGLATVVVLLPALGLEQLVSLGWQPPAVLIWPLTVLGWAAGLTLFLFAVAHFGLKADVTTTTIMAAFGLVISVTRVRTALRSSTPSGLRYDPSSPPTLSNRK